MQNQNKTLPQVGDKVTRQVGVVRSRDKRTMKRVLVVDDHEGTRDLMEAILRRQEPFEVLLAKDGKQALKIVRRERPDLILLDVMMPKKNGYEVCRAVKGNPITTETRVIVLTGLAEAIDRSRATKAGADAYFVKPFNLRELHCKADELLVPA